MPKIINLKKWFQGRWKQRPSFEQHKTNNTSLYIIGIIIMFVVYGAILRCCWLSDSSFWLDEAVSVVHIKAIMKYGIPRLECERVSWDAFPFHYFACIGPIISANIHVAYRLLSVVSGVVAIPLTFVLCRFISGMWLHGVFAAFIMTFMTYEICWSRQARFYSFLQLMMILSMICLFKFADVKRIKYLIYSLCFCVICMLTHRSGYMILLLTGLYGVICLYKIRLLLCGFIKTQKLKFFFILSFFLLIILLLLLVPSHANLHDVLQKLVFNESINYMHQYTSFLWNQFGYLLVLFVVGALIMIFKYPYKAIPILLSGLAYFLVLCFRWKYFSFRYSFPLFVIIILFATFPSVYLVSIAKTSKNKIIKRVYIISAILLCTIGIYKTNFTFVPRKDYVLGFTAPQPRWDVAYAKIAKREKLLNRDICNIVTISSLPLMHDIYLENVPTNKYYLPISFTGYSGDLAYAASYTSAKTINNLNELMSIKGYIIMDDFSIRMLLDENIKQYLSHRQPDLIIKDDYNIYVWLNK
jgi:hypothetical protein